MKKIFFLLFFFFFFFFISDVRAATITVCLQGGCDFNGVKGIQEAVEKAADGDIVLIKPGTYTSTVPVVVNPDYKFKNCLVDTKGKKITIRGEGGVVLNNGNGGLEDPTQISTGICVLGGEVTIDSITIRQTLRPAIYLQNARAIIKNVTYLDIDSVSVDMHQSQAIFLNNLFAGGGGISVPDTSYARVENNTFYGGGISFNLCDNNEPGGDVSNNLFTRGNIIASCSEQTQKLAKIKVSNNFVYRGSSTGDFNCAGPGNTAGEECAAGEICTGTTFGWPGFIGADENGTVCVWGEGFIQGGFNAFNTKADSPATLAGAGISTGPCTNGASATCNTYIKVHPFPEIPVEPEVPPIVPPGPGPGPNPNPEPNPHPGPGQIVPPNPRQSMLLQTINPDNLPEILGKLIDLPNNYTQEETTKPSSSGGMDLFMYVVFSLVYIMVMHFAINMGSEFSLGFMVSFFVLGGAIGGWLNTYESGFVVAAILSLMFIGGPKKEM